MEVIGAALMSPPPRPRQAVARRFPPRWASVGTASIRSAVGRSGARRPSRTLTMRPGSAAVRR
jgi:NAD-dependent DNA ligase